MNRLFSALKTIGIMIVVSIVTLYAIQYLNDHQQKAIEHQETTVHQVLGNPFVHRGDGKPNDVAQPGDLIFVHNEYVKTERCHVQVANLLINRENDDVLHHSQFLNWFNKGTFKANEMIHLPEWLPVGTYRLIKRSTSFCGDRTYYFVNFDVEVRVTPRSPPAPTLPTTAKVRPPRRPA